MQDYAKNQSIREKMKDHGAVPYRVARGVSGRTDGVVTMKWLPSLRGVWTPQVRKCRTQ